MKKTKIAFVIVLVIFLLYSMYQFFLISSGKKSIQLDKGVLFSITFDKSSYNIGEEIKGTVEVRNMSFEKLVFKKCDLHSNIYVETSETVERFYSISGDFYSIYCDIGTENFNSTIIKPFDSVSSSFSLKPFENTTDNKIYNYESLDMKFKFDKSEIFVDIPIQVEKIKGKRNIPSFKKEIQSYVWKNEQIRSWLKQHNITDSYIKDPSYDSKDRFWKAYFSLNEDAEKSSGFSYLKFVIDKDSGSIVQSYAHKQQEEQDEFILDPITLLPYFEKDLTDNSQKFFVVKIIPKEISKFGEEKAYSEKYQNIIEKFNGEFVEFDNMNDSFLIKIKGKDLLELESLKIWRSIEEKGDKK